MTFGDREASYAITRGRLLRIMYSYWLLIDLLIAV